MPRASLVALCLALLAPLMLPLAAAAAEAATSRFVSLRAAEVNLRAGPGNQYPVAWVYRRPGLPLEVIAEFDVWRRVRDWQGEEGWVHSNMLSTRRTVIITSKLQPLREKPNGASPAVAQAEAGVIGKLLRCPADFRLVSDRGQRAARLGSTVADLGHSRGRGLRLSWSSSTPRPAPA